MTDDHARPDLAAMKTALGTTKLILDGADLKTAHQAAEAGSSCPACVAVAGMSFGITLASEMGGDKAFVSEPLRLAMLDAVAAAERELGFAGN